MAKSQVGVLILQLKELLRARRLRHQDIAAELNVTPRTVRRWLSGDSVETVVLERLCGMLGLSFFDLCELAAKGVEARASRMTVAQEQALVSDPVLAYLFNQILRGWTSAELQTEAGLPESIFVKGLIGLEKAGFIDLLPGNQIRLRTTKDVQLIPNGPYSRHIGQRLGLTLRDVDISDPSSLWTVEALKLSTASIAQLRRRFEALLAEARDLGDADRRAGDASRSWYMLILTARQMANRDILPPI